MFQIGKKYKFQLKNGTVYTGDLVEEDDNLLQVINDIEGTLFIAKSEILRCVAV